MAAFAASLRGPSPAAVPPEALGRVLAEPLSVLPPLSRVGADGVEELVLSRRGLQFITRDAFLPLPFLSRLIISHNELNSLEGIEACPRLKHLFAAHNLLVHLASIEPLYNLETLDVSFNALVGLDAVLAILETFPRLTEVVLEGCPCAEEVNYRARVLARLPALVLLDHRPVTSAERRAAILIHGSTSNGTAHLRAVRAAAHAAITAERTAREEASTARTTEPRVSRSNVLPLRSDGCLELGHETGRMGLPRGSLPLPPRNIVVGAGRGVLTTTQALLAKRVASIQAARAAEAERVREAEVGGRPRPLDGWTAIIDHSTADGVGTSGVGWGGAAKTVPPRITTSALVNVLQPEDSETLLSRHMRAGMLSRGVDAALLERGSREATAAASASAQAGLLIALAPTAPIAYGTSPLPREGAERVRGEEAAATIGGAVLGKTSNAALGGSALSASLRSLDSKGFSALTATLSAARPVAHTSARGPLHELTLRSRVRTALGVHLTATRTEAAAKARMGLTREGDLDDALGAAALAAAAGLHGPLQPSHSLITHGSLGEWDRHVLHLIFNKADTDASGELSRDEIKGCLAACADYGFCVQTDDEAAGRDTLVAASIAAAAAAAAAATGGSSSARVGTAPELHRSMALLGTTSSTHRAAPQGTLARLDALLDEVFAATDVDGSGSVSWREFMVAMEGGPPLARNKGSAAGGAGATLSRVAKIGKGSNVPTLPRLRFRPLTAPECTARAQRHFVVASDRLARLNALTTSAAASSGATGGAASTASIEQQRAAFLVEASARLRAEAANAAVRGTRLTALASSLSGSYDPPEAPSAPPPPRSDFLASRVPIPASEVARLKQRGGSRYRIPAHHDEYDSFDADALAVLHPSHLQQQLEAEDAYEGGFARVRREAAADAVRARVGSKQWERARAKSKGRAPHAMVGVRTALSGVEGGAAAGLRATSTL